MCFQITIIRWEREGRKQENELTTKKKAKEGRKETINNNGACARE